ESTTIVKLMDAYGFREAIPREMERGMAVWGTCAGMIAVARRLTEPYPEPLGLIDIVVSRNWFGRQVDSFETDLAFEGIGREPFHAVFIRAPVVAACGASVKVLAKVEQGPPVAVRDGQVLATAFHPELTDDNRIHRYFVEMASEGAKTGAKKAARPAGGDD
ncbi:MAG: pyridoxal 5'-phosphate synthase glutaminase subunit PdxT, partial [Gemmatimonadetes bacterium]|nr:pyridoxal 5'-phosphate synthase glutaminase subunit PdxT [Gemmatimonadota bacterium]